MGTHFNLIDREERATHEGTKLLKQPAVKGILLGYQDIWVDTYMVIIDEPKDFEQIPGHGGN